MGDSPWSSWHLRPLHAPRLSVTPTVSANADSIASTLPTICHTVFLAGVWGGGISPGSPGGALDRRPAGRAEGPVAMGGGGEERIIG